uniref:Uncharacterized protein n=1 Tax=Peronospora matthiolae TaxID=2874970 RepID=A0AAV1UFU3_9STRA
MHSLFLLVLTCSSFFWGNANSLIDRNRAEDANLNPMSTSHANVTSNSSGLLPSHSLAVDVTTSVATRPSKLGAPAVEWFNRAMQDQEERSPNGGIFGVVIDLYLKIFGGRGLSPAIVAEHLAIDESITSSTIKRWLELTSQDQAPGDEVKLEEAYGVITKRAGHYHVMVALSQLLKTETVTVDAIKNQIAWMFERLVPDLTHILRAIPKVWRRGGLKPDEVAEKLGLKQTGSIKLRKCAVQWLDYIHLLREEKFRRHLAISVEDAWQILFGEMETGKIKEFLAFAKKEVPNLEELIAELEAETRKQKA